MKKWLKIMFGIVGIIVLLFVIDLICIFAINKPLFAIKEDNGNSVDVVYRGLLYDTYICPEYSVPQIKGKGTKFICAYVDIVGNKGSVFTPIEIETVSINISDISLTGATITIKDTNKNPYTYGEWYKIEKQINDKWYEVKTTTDDYWFNAMEYLVDKNNEVKFVIDWEWLYGELPLGNYRILKQVNNQFISIEFDISPTSKKIEVIKPEYHKEIKFNKYLEIDNRTIYLAGNLEEVFYSTDSNTKITLKDHITKVYQTIDDSIKDLTDSMTLTDTLKDGATTIHKSEKYDITIIKCNTLDGNKDIFIGDYSMNFNSDSMCK